jgi:hypothetical protein
MVAPGGRGKNVAAPAYGTIVMQAGAVIATGLPTEVSRTAA